MINGIVCILVYTIFLRMLLKQSMDSKENDYGVIQSLTDFFLGGGSLDSTSEEKHCVKHTCASIEGEIQRSKKKRKKKEKRKQKERKRENRKVHCWDNRKFL